LKILKYSGIAAGFLIATMAASRGGWVAGPPLLALWILFRSRIGPRRLAFRVLFIAGFIALGVLLMPDVAKRAVSSAGEVSSWLDGSNTETAAGQRLSIWKLGLALFAERPFTGYGSAGVAEQLALPEFAMLASPTINTGMIYGGPHNDLLGMMLGSGILGIAAFALLLFAPIHLFWRRRGAAEPDVRLACELGICLAAGVFLCGLTNEMLSLKYLASFYGITIAGLAAQVLGAAPRPVSQSV
ncbi:MAG: O-antigen ligase family protein, partial [Rhodocyclaceae bacterium]|nr:O-antigen ligase family protein [Rhodocyclaceae bacterium]